MAGKIAVSWRSGAPKKTDIRRDEEEAMETGPGVIKKPHPRSPSQSFRPLGNGSEVNLRVKSSGF